MKSSGDPKADASALRNVVGIAVPRPNQRTWFEWLPLQADGDDQGGGVATPMPDCSALDREARAKANVR